MARIDGRPRRGVDNAVDKAATHLTQNELALRWRVSPRSLERWRWLRIGPSFHKIGGRVTYKLTDVEDFERRRRAEIDPGILGHWGDR